MALSDNKLKIQELIDAINAQPGGGSGGGLPAGISHLASGTFTPAYDNDSGIEVEHGFGVRPNFYIVAIEDDVSRTILPNAIICSVVFTKEILTSEEYPFVDNSYRWGVAHGEDGNAYYPQDAMGYEIGNENSYNHGITDTTITFDGLYDQGFGISFPFKAGHTYRWICGVIDGIN